MTSIWSELRRRNVIKVAATYAVVAWFLIEISSLLLPTFEAPQWVLKVFILLIGLGFVLALFLSWAYDLTPQGVMRADGVDLRVSRAPKLPGASSTLRSLLFWYSLSDFSRSTIYSSVMKRRN